MNVKEINWKKFILNEIWDIIKSFIYPIILGGLYLYLTKPSINLPFFNNLKLIIFSNWLFYIILVVIFFLFIRYKNFSKSNLKIRSENNFSIYTEKIKSTYIYNGENDVWEIKIPFLNPLLDLDLENKLDYCVGNPVCDNIYDNQICLTRLFFTSYLFFGIGKCPICHETYIFLENPNKTKYNIESKIDSKIKKYNITRKEDLLNNLNKEFFYIINIIKDKEEI